MELGEDLNRCRFVAAGNALARASKRWRRRARIAATMAQRRCASEPDHVTIAAVALPAKTRCAVVNMPDRLSVPDPRDISGRRGGVR
jgi:hypothetical protein